MENAASSPLDGIRVIDFSRYLPGPFCSLQLAWLGATVHTVEQPPAGDPMRSVPPFAEDGVSLASHSLMRHKERHLLDLGDDDCRAEALALCATADVVVESFRPGVAARLGIGYEQLRETNPRLVYCSLSGYGQTGPWAQVAGHDANYESIAGLLHGNGPAERPVLPALPLADLAGASSAVSAICAALFARERTGIGAHLDIALTESALAWQAHALPAAADASSERAGGLLTGALACYGIYECSDGNFITVAAIEPKFFARVCELLDIADRASLQYDLSQQHALRDALAQRFATRTAEDWHTLMATDETCVSRVHPPSDAAQHPQLTAREAVEFLDGNAQIPMPRSPFVIDGQRTDQS